MKKLLWLDDYRNPFDIETDWMIFSPIGRDVEIHWVKNYQEFIDWITENDLPDGVCFDHDLGEEKTGYDCTKWLVDFCLDRNIQLPPYNIQSGNTCGKENINGLLKNYIMFFNDNLK
jgi:hypothetical protein